MIQKKSIRFLAQLIVCSAALVTLPKQAQAQQTGRHTVINVRADNALNVRAEHDSKSKDIGSASPGSELEVVAFSPKGGWAKVKWEQSFGWVSVRFLRPVDVSENDTAAVTTLQKPQSPPALSEQQEPHRADTADKVEPAPEIAAVAELAKVAPEPTALTNPNSGENPSVFCSGNGPNWQLSLNQHGTLVFKAPDNNSLYATTQWRQSTNSSTYVFSVSNIRGTLLNKACVDKRSNSTMQWQLELHTDGFGGSNQLTGCCSNSR